MWIAARKQKRKRFPETVIYHRFVLGQGADALYNQKMSSAVFKACKLMKATFTPPLPLPLKIVMGSRKAEFKPERYLSKQPVRLLRG